MSKEEIKQEFKELQLYLDALCLQKEKDAGHLWIEFTDKFNAFQKAVLKTIQSQSEQEQDELWQQVKSILYDSEDLGFPFDELKKTFTIAKR